MNVGRVIAALLRRLQGLVSSWTSPANESSGAPSCDLHASRYWRTRPTSNSASNVRNRPRSRTLDSRPTPSNVLHATTSAAARRLPARAARARSARQFRRSGRPRPRARHDTACSAKVMACTESWRRSFRGRARGATHRFGTRRWVPLRRSGARGLVRDRSGDLRQRGSSHSLRSFTRPTRQP